MFNIVKLFKSFGHAFDGIITLLRQEQNFRLHVLASAIVIVCGFYFEIRPWQWALLVIMICLVFILEMINTIVERLLDVLKPRLHEYVKDIKDIMSAMVLISALSSVAVGLIIFLPYL